MYIWKRRKRRRGSCKQESKLGMDGGRRVEWAQEEDDEGESKGGPGPPRGTAGSKGELSRTVCGCALAVLLLVQWGWGRRKR
jgi:hypothetical protein